MGIKTAAMCAADRRSVAYHALAKAAGKRCDRNQLLAGAAYDVDLKITGKIGRGSVNETVVGTLTVGEDSVRNKSFAVPQAELLAVVAAGLGDAARQRLYKRLRETFLETGGLPPFIADKAAIADAEALIGELRSTTTETKKGDVAFVAKSG